MIQQWLDIPPSDILVCCLKSLSKIFWLCFSFCFCSCCIFLALFPPFMPFISENLNIGSFLPGWQFLYFYLNYMFFFFQTSYSLGSSTSMWWIKQSWVHDSILKFKGQHSTWWSIQHHLLWHSPEATESTNGIRV